MSFRLTDLMNGQLHTAQTQQGSSSQGVRARQSAAAGESKLTIGSVVSGQITKVEGSSVQIQLSQGGVMNASVDEGLHLAKGDSVTFEVSGLHGKQTILRALFQNSAAGMATITKALEQAGIAQTGRAASMVNSMMENGMPIDKTSVLEMYKQILEFPQASGKNIVAMNRLQIPVNEANLTQLEAYLNFEHQIAGSVQCISDSIMDSFRQLMTESGTGESAAFMRQIVSVFGEELTPMQLEQLVQTDASQSEEMLTQQPTSAADALMQAIKQAQEGNGAAKHTQNQLADANQVAAANGEGQTQASFQELPADIKMETSAALGELGLSSEMQQRLMAGDMSPKEVMDFVKTQMAQNAWSENLTDEKLAKLFQTKGFEQLLRSEISRQWLMEPASAASREGVEAFYAKLTAQSHHLTNALSQIARADTLLYQQVMNMQENVDFMNQLSQTVNYVQLPLKMNGENTHGDLYVYTNKRNLTQQDGNVSAFLHLDMEHLGPVDVYVAMQQQKVSTQFYLQDDEMIDFISEHISMLDDRLAAKGYAMNTTLTHREKNVNVMQEIIEDQKETVLVGTSSFDIRA